VNRTYPSSCCASDVTDQFSISHRPLASPVVFRTDDAHQRNLSDIVEVTWNHVMPMDSTRNAASNAIGGAILNNDKNKIPCRAVYQKVRARTTLAVGGVREGIYDAHHRALYDRSYTHKYIHFSFMAMRGCALSLSLSLMIDGYCLLS
jgi:hypothetical protein